jgi:hypothetical protein
MAHRRRLDRGRSRRRRSCPTATATGVRGATSRCTGRPRCSNSTIFLTSGRPRGRRVPSREGDESTRRVRERSAGWRRGSTTTGNSRGPSSCSRERRASSHCHQSSVCARTPWRDAICLASPPRESPRTRFDHHSDVCLEMRGDQHAPNECARRPIPDGYAATPFKTDGAASDRTRSSTDRRRRGADRRRGAPHGFRCASEVISADPQHRQPATDSRPSATERRRSPTHTIAVHDTSP